MPAGRQPQVTLTTQGYKGLNTALQFSQLQPEQSPRMMNAWMSKLGAIGKRPGTVPVTTSALNNPIRYLTTYKASPAASSNPEIYAAAGTTLYKFNGTNAFNALTMTNNLSSADIYTVGYTNSALVSRLIIGDGGSLKACDGSEVKNITPATDDPSPAPPNVLNDVNAKGCKYIWEYSGYIFISPGTNELFFTKRYHFDYVPQINYFLLVNDNDYINGAGVAFDAVCLIPMRRGWAILTGETTDNFKADKFLNTTKGVIAPRSISVITYPNGQQTIAYLSDDGPHEVYTSLIDGGGRQYATRAMMENKVDFEAIGLSESEKSAAVGFFDSDKSLYYLSFEKDGTPYTYVYDTRNKEWYPWSGFDAKAFVSLDGVTYFSGGTGHLHIFDNSLYSDWDDAGKTSGTPVHFYRYSPLLALEHTGYASYWDYYIVEQKQYTLPSSLDIYAIFTYSPEQASFVIGSTVALWDDGEWDVAQWGNENFTEPVNEPRRIVYKKKSKYVQVLWENNRDEPVEVYWDKWIGRVSGQ